jgi:rhodanese-related sulfurtransferase
MTQVKFKSISPVALSALLGTGKPLVLLDVRTPPEYARAHVPGTRLIPLNDLKVDTLLAQHQPGAPIFVLCQSGGRAAKAIEQFEHGGCDDCVLVEGGTQAWIDAGLSVHHGARTVIPIMRQVQIVVGSLSAIGAILTLVLNPWFAVFPLLLGCGLVFAGVSGTCGMALLLARMPWNRGQAYCSHCCGQE